MASERENFHVDCKANGIKIDWVGIQSQTQTYIVKFREQSNNAVFKHIQTKENEVFLPNLKGGTLYEIKVYIQEDDGDERLYFSTPALTAAPTLSPFIKMCDKISDKPTIYRFRPSNIRNVGKLGIDVRVCAIGPNEEGFEPGDTDKTILIVGARAVGKSTLIDAIINYLAGVRCVDDYRFKLVDDGYNAVTKSKVTGETKGITCYKVQHLKGFNVENNLIIIDTPGFDDKTYSNHNFNIVQQLTVLLESGFLKFIDAVCLVLPSSCRLTEGQRNIFGSIMSLFGKDINFIIPMVTFDDGGQINALGALKKADVPYMDHMYFRFNNSGLFNTLESEEALNRRYNSLKCFFENLQVIARQSVESTLDVLKLIGHFRELTELLHKKKELIITITKSLVEDKATEKDLERVLRRNENYYYEDNEFESVREVNHNQMCLNCHTCMETCEQNCSCCTRFFWWFIQFCSWFWSFGCIRLLIRCLCCPCVLCDIPATNLLACKCKCLLVSHRRENKMLVQTYRKVQKENAEKKATYESATVKRRNVQKHIRENENELHSLANQCDSHLHDLRASFEQIRKIALRPGSENEVKKWEEYFKNIEFKHL